MAMPFACLMLFLLALNLKLIFSAAATGDGGLTILPGGDSAGAGAGYLRQICWTSS